jgi:hypothetical protein
MDEGTVIGIIRVNSKTLEKCIEVDHAIWGKHLDYSPRHITPMIRVLSRTIRNTHEFVKKPLLFSYGFVELPLHVAHSRDRLEFLRTISTGISSFVYRRKSDLYQQSLVLRKVAYDTPQVMIETISQGELDRLGQHAIEGDSYNPVLAKEELSIGSIVILKGYPFANLLAQIENRFKKTYKVTLLSTGVSVTIPKDNLYYSPYDESPSREVTFTELGYTPDI